MPKQGRIRLGFGVCNAVGLHITQGQEMSLALFASTGVFSRGIAMSLQLVHDTIKPQKCIDGRTGVHLLTTLTAFASSPPHTDAAPN